jgi:hypothetical protein
LPGSKAIGTGVNVSLAKLQDAVTAQATTLTVYFVSALYPGMLLRLGSEVVRVTAFDPVNRIVTVQRGVAGTSASAHASLTQLFLGSDQRGALRPGITHVDIGAFD